MGILGTSTLIVMPPSLIDMSQNEESRKRTSPPINEINGETSPTQDMANSKSMGMSNNAGKRGRKTDREREESGGRREWTDGEISLLITLWRDNDILYDTNHPLYYVQSERKLVMEYISKEMNIHGRDVNDKMHSLRTYYCSQRQRTEAIDAKCGSSRTFPRWKFYDQMSFLYESVTNRAAKSSLSSTRRGRKPREPRPEQTQSQQIPYTMMHTGTHPDFSTSTSSRNEPPLIHPSERGYTEERYELLNGHQRHPTTPQNFQAMNSPTSSEDNPRKRQCSDDGWPEMYQYKEQSAARKEYKTIEIPLNTGDELFGHMVASSLAQIGDEQEKELLKLEIQKLIYNKRFKPTG